ncbi:hypothetical protein [Croceitalea rosinachiae]|uniref:Activator of Hsp90 ATPase homolog 1-like protein n=1 Tax=Croceitalea rosinachiae TaxID=3075596 RepID=A0ABU3AGX2_9FLAO|nr:hypothetical protein [Croceitalea sp. F388]MDT0608146.1 hypothetical protein [Croceitalea sp. F388]
MTIKLVLLRKQLQYKVSFIDLQSNNFKSKYLMDNYMQSVLISGSNDKIFGALTVGIDKWWGEVNQQANNLGSIFKVSFGEAFWVFKVTHLERDSTITWECIESNQVHAGLKGVREEWLGTKLHWNITSKDNQTTNVDFLHEGLVPTFNCYDVCSKAWDYFITDSLKSYIEEGIGKPEK